MSRHVPTKVLAPDKEYSIPEFLALCNDDPQVIEFALMRIVSLREAPARRLLPHQVKATGAEFQAAMDAARRVVDLLQGRPCCVEVPGHPSIQMSMPSPLTFTELFRALPIQ